MTWLNATWCSVISTSDSDASGVRFFRVQDEAVDATRGRLSRDTRPFSKFRATERDMLAQAGSDTIQVYCMT